MEGEGGGMDCPLPLLQALPMSPSPSLTPSLAPSLFLLGLEIEKQGVEEDLSKPSQSYGGSQSSII